LAGSQIENLEEDVPSPAQFDHVFTAVRLGGEWIYTDATSGVAPLGYLSPLLRGKLALRIPQAGESDLVDLPHTKPYAERLEVGLDGEVDDAGTLRAEVTIEMRGDSEWMSRLAFRNLPAAQWGDLARNLVPFGLSGKVTNLDVSDLSDVARPFTISFRAESEEWLDVSKPEQSVGALLPSLAQGLGRWEDLTDDDGKVALGGPLESRYVSRVRLPSGFEVEPPIDVSLELEGLGTYSAAYDASDGALSAERRLTFGPRELEADAEPRYTSL
jgi:hypothetical protein